MDALFFIEFPETSIITSETPLNWYKKTPDNTVTFGYQAFNTLKPLIDKSYCIGVLSSQHIYETRSELNIKNRKQREQALRYDLEEQLAEDIENIHIAYTKNSNDHHLDIIIINKTFLNELLDSLKQVDIQLNSLISDSQLIHQAPEDWLIFAYPHHFLFKTPQKSHTIGNHNLISSLEILNQQMPGPDKIEFYCADDYDNRVLEPTLKLNIKTFDTPLFNQLCQYYSQPASINILQGEYQTGSQNSWRLIQYSGTIASILLICLILFQNYQNKQLEEQEQHLENQITSLYRESFPKSKRIVNPLAQMRSGLQKLEKNTQHQTYFFTLLADLSRALHKQKNINTQQIHFNKNTLTFEFTTSSLAELEQFKDKLSQQNLTVKILSATKANNRVLANINITR